MPSPHFLLPRHSDEATMSDFTQHSHDSTTITTTSSSMDGMDMSSSSTSSHSSMGSMTFHAGISDPLYATRWTPATKGQYAGTVIFLILLAFFYRFLVAYRSVLEHRWEKRDSSRDIIISGASQESGIENPKGEMQRGVSVQRGMWGGKPWRWSVDLPRSCLAVLASGVGYLLMLAVMTFNIGYFLSVLGGIFAGELVWGRWIKTGEH